MNSQLPPPLVVAMTCTILQWVASLVLPPIPDFNPDQVLIGNLQIIGVIWVYQTITKYVKF